MDPRPTDPCRWCGAGEGTVVLDLGDQPAADHFPAADDPGPDPVHPLRMWLCGTCGLAQLAEDPTTPEEPRGAEPDALVAQARDAVARVEAAGLLPKGGTVREFGSPHGGSWLDLLGAAGLEESAGEPADVVIDCFGLMHAADQRAGLAERVAATAPGGVLLLQFHTLAAIVADGGWNALRHGHFAYYATPVLARMLDELGLEATHGFLFDLYGGTVLLAARRHGVEGPRDRAAVDALLERETALGVTDPAVVAGLEEAASRNADALRAHLEESRAARRTVLGYAAASRSVPLLNRAGIGADLLPAVADSSPGKQGRRFPGADIPIIAPDAVAGRRPDEVVLFVTDMLAEMRRRMPEVEAGGGTWVVVDPVVRRVAPAR
ncbi:methyltransferase C-terminal domain-containing protein [Actinomycetospora lutea]|uniref:methyltransferase C-terminal domain-containing protein n=1 Tax=Actinomycetospora lutea TaxID=663604 RepID=UPI0023658FD2|nr:methyltransferase C-terminal domain-containing protein [Actinomycetospora lutea]MDD7940809.1 methyltransferase C-terminal domain-containing protein [Actinomycetospora lutea]